MREYWPGRLGQQREELEKQLEQRNWIEAERIVEAARRSYRDTPFPTFLAGILELARGNAMAAEKAFSDALALAPRFPTFLAALARTWARTGGAAAAGERLMGLAEGDPGLASARYMAARAYIEARDPIRAEAALTRGLQLQPDSPLPYQHLADYYFGVDRAPDALAICMRGLERIPDAVDLQLMLAQIDAGLHRTDDAVRAYQAVLTMRPDMDLARYKLGVLLASSNDDSSKAPLAGIARQLENDRPSDPLLIDALGWILLRGNQPARGRELLEEAVKGAPEEPRLHFHLAVAYTQLHKRDAAARELKAAVASERPFAERLDALRMMRENSALATPKH
jgi:predicted Zn-dependent protease